MKCRFCILVLLFVLSFGCWQTAAGESPCERYGRADAVFLGQLVAAEYEKDSPIVAPRYIFDVVEAFYGIKNQTRVTIDPGSSTYTFRFEKGSSYLVYADEQQASAGKDKNVLSAWFGIYSFEEAAEDLAFLRNLSGQKGMKVTGEIAENISAVADQELTDRAIAGKKIRFTGGANQIFEAITDGAGMYEITLPAGRYKIDLADDDFFRNLFVGIYRPPTVNAKDGGCLNNSFFVTNRSEVHGRITKADGKPLKDTSIELHSEAGEIKSPGYLLAKTNANGYFLFDKIPVGRYYLSVSPDDEKNLSEVFYPGVLDKSRAQIIEVGLGQKIENLQMRLPKKGSR